MEIATDDFKTLSGCLAILLIKMMVLQVMTSRQRIKGRFTLSNSSISTKVQVLNLLKRRKICKQGGRGVGRE